MQWESSGFVNIGSLCSLAQQSLLCIKHLRTEVLNNILIFPVDGCFLFGDNSFVLVPLSGSDVLSPAMTWMPPTHSLELVLGEAVVVCLPVLWGFLVGSSRQ